MDFLPPSLEAMASYRQFIVYKLQASKNRPGKYDKIPVDPHSLRPTNAHDESVWMSAKDAIKASVRLGAEYGTGFVFTKADPFWFLDIDDAYNIGTQSWSQLSQELLILLNGCAVEVSSSGRGLHIFGSGVLPNHACRNVVLKLELYTSGRFVALTGTHASGDIRTYQDANMISIINKYFSRDEHTTAAPADLSRSWNEALSVGARPEWNGNQSDEELIRRALASTSGAAAFGMRASFRDLWDADIDALTRAFPDGTHVHGYNASSADQALAMHLAFWTGNHAERMQRLMLQSGLAREKYEREDYLPRTILAARAKTNNWLCDKPTEPPQVVQHTTQAKAVRRNGSTFLGVEQQEEHFKGCVYVRSEHKVMIPGGYMLDADRFKAVYGGFSYTLDQANQKTTRNAFEAFTQSSLLAHPNVQHTCFRPDLAAGAIFQHQGETFVNTYFPVPTAMVNGDIQPFLDHINRLWPHIHDQNVLIGYMAAIVQYVGYKFPWTPILQGVEGNGKTIFSKILAFCIGDRYTHYPKAEEMLAKFNDWLYGRIFIPVEDIYMGERVDAFEKFKIIITGEQQEIEPKGGTKVTRRICANFLLNSNHQNAVRKTENDRRIAALFCAQQRVKDLKRDGLTVEYFNRFFHWLLYEKGFEKINYFLRHYAIPDAYNPLKDARRAPETTSSAAAIKNSFGRVEQHILEQIELEAPGFRKGWISTVMLDRFFATIKADHISPYKRKEMLSQLGYLIHPALGYGGRTDDPVRPDGSKTRLYVTSDHYSLKYTRSSEARLAYERDQT